MKNKIMILGLVSLILIVSIMAIVRADICECNSCGSCMNALNNASCTEVRLTANITNFAGTCIDNPSGFNNKIFDCQGYTIDGDDSGEDYGIYLNGKTNNTIKNCMIIDFYYGIYLLYSSNNILTNNTASSNYYGIYLWYSSNNILTNNTASSNYYGIYLWYSSNNILTNNTASSNYYGIYLWYSLDNILTNNTASSNYYGIYLWYSSNNILTNNIVSLNNQTGIYLLYSSNNILTNNTASSNYYGIYLDSSLNNNIYNNFFNNTNNFYFGWTIYANNWNTTKTPGTNIVGGLYLGGNFWANPSGTGFSETCTDADEDGICDNPYTLTTDNVDYLPLSSPCFCNSCSSCNSQLNNAFCTEVNLTADITNFVGSCINNPEGFNNKIFNCQRHGIYNNGTGTAVYLNNKQNNVIKNCLIVSNEYGINLNNSQNITLNNNEFLLNEKIYIDGGYYNITNNVFNQISHLYLNGENHIIYNNFFRANNYHFNISNSILNTTMQQGERIAGLKNIYNSIGGNYWSNPNVDYYSDRCEDNDFNGFCDQPFVIGDNATDYLPLTAKFGLDYEKHNAETLEGSEEDFEIQFYYFSYPKSVQGIYFIYENDTSYYSEKPENHKGFYYDKSPLLQIDLLPYTIYNFKIKKLVPQITNESNLYEIKNFTYRIQFYNQNQASKLVNGQQTVHKLSVSTSPSSDFPFKLYQLNLKDIDTFANVTGKIEGIIELISKNGKIKREYSFNLTGGTYNITLYTHYISPDATFFLKTKLNEIKNSSYYTTGDYVCMETDSNIFGNNTIYLYYGGTNTYNWNGENIFLFFDDFEGNELNLSKWEVYNNNNGTYNVSNGRLRISSGASGDNALYVVNKISINNNFIAEVVGNGSVYDGKLHFGLRSQPYQNSTMISSYDYSTSHYIGKIVRTTEGGGTSLSNLGGTFTTNWRIKFVVPAKNTSQYYFNDVLKSTDTNANFNFSYIMLTSSASASAPNDFKYVFVRKYYDKEPTIFIGAETIVGNERKREIFVKNPYSYSLENYSLLIILDTQTLIANNKMRADCKDIHIRDTAGNELPVWIEEGTCNTTTTRIWTKVNLGVGSARERDIYLYNAASNTLSKVFFNVKDKDQRNYNNAFVEFYELRKDGYLYIGSTKADVYGSIVKNILEDKKYKIAVIDYNSCEKVAEKEMLISCKSTPCLFNIIASKTGSFFETLQDYGLKYSWNYDKENKLLKFEYDATNFEGGLKEFKLTIYHRNVKENELVCEKKSSSVADYFECSVVGFLSEYEGVYEALSLDGKIVTGKIQFSEKEKIFGLDSLIYSAIVITALFFVGIFNPAVAIIMSVIGLITLTIFGFVALPYLAVILIISIAIIIIIKIKS